jgi:ATP-dependent Clp protease adaptor protein ClpS
LFAGVLIAAGGTPLACVLGQPRRLRLECHKAGTSCSIAGAASCGRLDKMIFMATKIPSTPPKPPAVKPGQDDGDAVVIERRPQKTAPPQMYQVVMLNDDYTPMEFVIVVIQEFFNKDRETATQIMLKIHLDGRGICGVYSRDMAATKVNQVMEAAHQAGHPLQCVSEPVE